MGIFQNKYKNKTDEVLIVLLSKGNESAFNELYSRYGEALNHFFYKMLNQDEEVAADFCQNLFLKIFEKAYTFDKQYKFSTWIYTMASNMCKNEYRRRSRKIQTVHLENIINTVKPKAAQNLDHDIFQSHLQIAINKLDDRHKMCFVLRYQENKSISEISDLIGIPQGTIKSRLHNTLRKLEKELQIFNPKKKINSI